jgi:predicted NBD/HSP70 family sugar kinase
MANKVKFISTGDIEEKIERKINRLLALVRKSPGISRQNCALKMRISTFNVSQMVPILVDKGMITEGKSDLSEKTRGRPSTPLYINREYIYFAGIDIEAVQWRFVIIDFAGNLVFSQLSSFQECHSRTDYIEQLTSLMQKAINAAGKCWEKVGVIGIGAPGFLDQETGIVETYEILPGFKMIPLLDIFKLVSGKPSYITHNIFNLATYALWKRNDDEKKVIMHAAIRSGISVAFNIGGRVYCGNNRRAGEMGLSMINGRTLQETAGISALKHLLPDLDDDFWHGNPDAIEKTYLRQDVRKIIDHAMDDIALCLANAAALLDNDEIIVYCALFPSENSIWGKLQNSFKKYRSLQKLKKIKFICATDSELNAACGAALYALEHQYPTQK